MSHLNLDLCANHRIQSLEIQNYINYAKQRECISFAAGLPDLSVLPIEDLMVAYHEIMHEDKSLFQYQAPIESLKEKIQSIMAFKSVNCKSEDILITNGAQQAIYLTTNLFLKHNASLMVEEFTYPGFNQIVNMFDLEFLPISYKIDTGIDLERLEYYLKNKNPLPYLYIICNGHNPLGITHHKKTRKKLAHLAEKYSFILVEDDPYGFLSFTDEKYLPLRAYTKNAIYIGSFSKIVSPALRIGWIVAESEIIKKLQQLKDMIDIYTSNPNHLVLNKLLEEKSLAEIVYPQNALYKEKRDCMIRAIEKYMDMPIHYEIPEHGLFIWIEFLDNNIEKYRDLIFEQSKVLYIPGSAFSTTKQISKQAMRLNYSSSSFEEIEMGIRNLSKALSRLKK